MKVALLASANSIHTIRWANGLVERGIDVSLISLHPKKKSLDGKVDFYLLPFGAPIGYLASVFALKKILRRISPDLLNVHYATGYGGLASLSGFSPTLLSVWGTDVYKFPYKSLLARYLVKHNLSKATCIASTSLCMADRKSVV